MSTLNASEDYDRFFQTTDTLETQARRAAKSSNTHGRPIRLPSKLSAVVVDPTSLSAASPGLASRVYVSGSDGCVRRVRLSESNALKPAAEAKKTTEDAVDLVLTGPKAPLTCLAVLPGQGNLVTVFAGCWDKSIYAWTVKDGKQVGDVRNIRNGHSDFVKCIAVHRVSTGGSSTGNSNQATLDILISGSADRSIVFWEASSGRRLAQFKNFHRTSVNTLTVDPVTDTEAADPSRIFTLISGASDGEILQTEFSVLGDSGSNVTVEVTGRRSEIQAHPTTVYGFAFCGEEADLLTASADGSATVVRRDEKGFGFAEVETRLKHEGHVRCVAGEMDGPRVYTGGRDENVKMWNTATGVVEVVFEGHFDEVTGLVVDGQRQHARAVTVSLDGTVRVWDAEEVERIRSGPQETEKVDEAPQSLMTAEEEAELAELMEDDD